jgi:hypothetical protein
MTPCSDLHSKVQAAHAHTKTKTGRKVGWPRMKEVDGEKEASPRGKGGRSRDQPRWMDEKESRVEPATHNLSTAACSKSEVSMSKQGARVR